MRVIMGTESLQEVTFDTAFTWVPRGRCARQSKTQVKTCDSLRSLFCSRPGEWSRVTRDCNSP